MYFQDFIMPIMLFLGGPLMIVVGSFINFIVFRTLYTIAVVFYAETNKIIIKSLEEIKNLYKEKEVIKNG